MARGTPGAARGGREDGWALPLQLALVTDGSDRGLAEQVRAGGADVVGLLAPEALESLVWAAEAQADHGYSALDALAADAVDAACLDLPLAGGVPGRDPAARGRGQRRAGPPGDSRTGPTVRTLLDAAAIGNSSAACSALRTRGLALRSPTRHGCCRTSGPLSQLTVIGLARRAGGRAELCDVVRRLCGDVVAVCGSASAMPAHELAPAAPVTLSLLTVGRDDGRSPTSRRRSAYSRRPADARRCARGGWWSAQRSLRISDVEGVREDEGGRPGRSVRVATEGLRDELAGYPSAAAGLGDLLAAARIMELAAMSYDSDTWVEA